MSKCHFCPVPSNFVYILILYHIAILPFTNTSPTIFAGKLTSSSSQVLQSRTFPSSSLLSERSREKCTGPENCAFCWNSTVRAIIRDINYKLPCDNEFEAMTEKVVLLPEQKVINNGTEDLFVNLTYSKMMKHSFSFSFQEPFPFVSHTILQAKYPVRPLHTPVDEEEILIGKSGGLETGEKLGWTKDDVLYEKSERVKIPAGETKRVSAHSLWLVEEKKFQIKFDAIIEFIGNAQSACVQCTSKRNFICYQVYLSSKDVLEILRDEKYGGEILYENEESGSVITRVSGVHTGNYGYQETFVES